MFPALFLFMQQNMMPVKEEYIPPKPKSEPTDDRPPELMRFDWDKRWLNGHEYADIL